MSVTYFLKAELPNGKSQLFELDEASYVVGRTSTQSPPNKLTVVGDPSLSRRQFTLSRKNEVLMVEPCSGSTNQMEVSGEVALGQHFVAARTTFHFISKADPVGSQIMESSLTAKERAEGRKDKAVRCLEVMTQFFPRIRQSSTNEALWKNTYELVHELLPQTRVAIISSQGIQGDQVQPSQKLLANSIRSGETVLHVWTEADNFTRVLGTDWAIAVPLPGPVVLYAEGKDTSLSPGSEERVLLDLVGETLSHHLMSQRLEQVGRFLSPSVRDQIMAAQFDELLKPRLLDVTVLFFDLRSSCLTLAQLDLHEYHRELTELMTQLTEVIFQLDGTVLDYVGDAIVACWGAPLAQADHAQRAYDAAVAMNKRTRELGKECGIGLATGEVMAGQVGAVDQAKYGIVGWPPNLASRLEGLCKVFGVPILVSEDCRNQLESARLRRIMTVRPAGIERDVMVHEVVVSKELGGTGLSAQQVWDFEDGRWHEDDPVVKNLRALGREDCSGVLEMLHK